VLAPDRAEQPIFRLFAIGRKQLPQVRRGEAHPEERNWALNVGTTSNPEELRRAFLATEYPTTTRGVRLVGGAKAAGEGRYQLLAHGSHTELAYVLELPKEPGPVQEEFKIKKTASYIVAVKNPEIQVPGFPSSEQVPPYPEQLREKLGERRWIEVDDPALLDHEGVQIMLLGARADHVEEELGIEIDEEEETARSAEIFRTLKLRREQVRARPLFRGEFPAQEMPVPGEEVARERDGRRKSPGANPMTAPARRPRIPEFRCEMCDETFDQRSRYERHRLISHPKPAPSAADVERALAGIDFPKTRRQLVAHAARRLPAGSEVLTLIRRLPQRRYRDAAEVAIALGAVKQRRASTG
jgi:hypothetical protein